MANVVLPQVSILNSLANDANLLVEQNGEINRFAVTDLDIGGGDVTIDLASGISSAANPIDADTLNGYEFDYFASKNDLNDYATAEQVEEIIANLPKDDLDIKLNYSVVGGTTQPTNPTENMIWVNTDQTINKIYFHDVEPKIKQQGDIWIYTGKSSSVSFNALSIENNLFNSIYPLYVLQYNNSVWEEKKALTFQNNEWVEWATYLVNKKNLNEDVTGGWTAYDGGYGTLGSYTFAENGIKVNLSGTNGSIALRTVNLIDLTDFSTLTIAIDTTVIGGSTSMLYLTNSPNVQFIVNSGLIGVGTNVALAGETNNSNSLSQPRTFDISTISGKWYVVWFHYLYHNGPSENIINYISLQR